MAGFFELGPTPATRPFRGEAVAGGDAAVRILRAEALPQGPVEVRWISGEASPGPVAWASGWLPLVRLGVLQRLREAGLTGFEPRIATVIDRRGFRLEDYVALAITGRAGPVDLSATHVEVREYPGGWFPRIVGPQFSAAAWDGSDFFAHATDSQGRYTALIFCSDRAHRALARVRGHGCRFVPVDRCEWSAILPAGAWRDRLPDYPDRVRQAYRDAGVPMPGHVAETLATLEDRPAG